MNKRNEQLYAEMLEVAKNRRTAKQYDWEKDVDQETLKQIFAFTKTAPSSMGLDLVRIVSISRDSELKKEISGYFKDYNQERAYMASNIALIITKKASFFTEDNESLRNVAKNMVKKGVEANGGVFEDGMENGFLSTAVNGDHANNGNNKEEWAARQGYIHLGYMLLAASSLGVESTTMEGFTSEFTRFLIEKGVLDKDERVTLAVGLGYVNPEAKGTFIGKGQLRVEDDEFVKYL